LLTLADYFYLTAAWYRRWELSKIYVWRLVNAVVFGDKVSKRREAEEEWRSVRRSSRLRPLSENCNRGNIRGQAHGDLSVRAA
jgi:hypothetical protein